MSEVKVYPVPESILADTNLTNEQYLAMYRRSMEDPDGFWAEQAGKFLHWFKEWDKVQEWNFDGDVSIKWFINGKLNISYNCLDRHLSARADQTAILWEGDEPDQDRAISYRELHDQVCRFANALKSHGVKKGDRVAIYLPMIPEAAVAALACTRLGAVHSIVFGGFSPAALKDRIIDSDCRIVITSDESVRGGRITPLTGAVYSRPH